MPRPEPTAEPDGRRRARRTATCRWTGTPSSTSLGAPHRRARRAGRRGTVVDPVRPGQTAVPERRAAPTELPHWTEPPTGQVPAVLSRDSGDESSGRGSVAPTWREEDADWVAHDEEFEPAMFADDEVALGSLDETDSTDAERRPWEFDLDSVRPAHPDRSGLGRSPSRTTPSRPDTDRPHHRAHRGGDPVSEDAAPAGVGGRQLAGRSIPGDELCAATGLRTAGAAAGLGSGAGGRRRQPWPAVGRRRRRRPPVPTGRRPTTELFADKPRPTGSTRLGPGPARRAAAGPDAGQAARGRRRGRPTRPWPPSPRGPRSPTCPAPAASGWAWPAWPPPTAPPNGTGSARPRVRDPATDWTRPAPDGVDVAATAAWPPASPVADRAPVDGRLLAGRPGRRPTAATPRPVEARRRPPAPARRSTADPPGQAPAGAARSGSGSGTGIAVAVVALLAFKLGTVTSLVLCLIVVTFAAGECFGVLRRAGYHPATPARPGRHHLPDGRGLRQGGRRPAAGPGADHRVHPDLVPVRHRAGLAGGRHRRHPAHRGVGVAARRLRRPAAVAVRLPRSARHRLPPRGHHRHRGQRRRGPGHRRLAWAATPWPRRSAPTRPGRGCSAVPSSPSCFSTVVVGAIHPWSAVQRRPAGGGGGRGRPHR